MKYLPSAYGAGLSDSVSQSSLSTYLKKIFAIPLLTQEQEQNLAMAWYEERCQESAQQLVLSHLRLVPKIASRYKDYGLPFMDLISEGNIGLMHAVRNFDPHKGFRLATYAIWWIRASIQDYILRSWSLVKIATTRLQKRLFAKLKSAKIRIGAFDRELTDAQSEQLANELGTSKKDVQEFNTRLSGDLSLDAPLGSDTNAGTLQDVLVSEGQNPEEDAQSHQERSRMRQCLARCMRQIPKRERYILWARRLRDGVATLEALSEKFKISRERVRQLESQAFSKLKELCLQEMGV